MRARVDNGAASAACGVVAVVFGSAAAAVWVTVVSSGSKFPAWPVWALSALTVLAIYLCFAFVFGLWPTSGDVKEIDGQGSSAVQIPSNARATSRDQPSATATTATRVPHTETLLSPWDRNQMPKGKIKGFRLRRKVRQEQWVKGKVSAPKRGARPMLLVHDISRGYYFDHWVHRNGNGKFKERITFGRIPGEELMLLLVFVPENVNFTYARDLLPEGVQVLDQRRLVIT